MCCRSRTQTPREPHFSEWLLHNEQSLTAYLYHRLHRYLRLLFRIVAHLCACSLLRLLMFFYYDYFYFIVKFYFCDVELPIIIYSIHYYCYYYYYYDKMRVWCFRVRYIFFCRYTTVMTLTNKNVTLNNYVHCR